MKWIDKWLIKHVHWIKSLDDLSIDELIKLKIHIENVIEVKLNETYKKKKLKKK